jgi:DNA polymerase-4
MPKLAHFRAKHDASALADGTTPILHVDMDAFFVSVELLDRPELRGKPVVVGGQPNRRGVVSAASYEARRFGIHSAMPLRTAGRLCPHAVFLEGRHDLYAAWSDRIAAILAKFSPVVEMASIDEAYLDLSGTERLHGPPLAAAHALLREIGVKTQLPCSAGLARTRLVAKVASDQAKPRGLLWIPAGVEAEFLAPLGVRRIPGIGKVTEAALHNLGIERVGQLSVMTQERLQEVFGQWGTALYRKSRGQDSYEFFVDAEPKSLSHSHTFGVDTRDGTALDAMLSRLCQKAAKRLRDAGLDARTVTLTIRYAGFETVTRAKTLVEPTHLDPIFLETIARLFDQHRDRRRAVRLIGVELGTLSHGATQLDLLDAPRRAKLEKLARATDRLRDRFGFAKVQFGGSLGTDDDH